VGVELAAQPGDAVKSGALLAHIHAASNAAAEEAISRVQSAFKLGREPVPQSPLIVETILPETASRK
jgi:thymidine phosphorylase